MSRDEITIALHEKAIQDLTGKVDKIMDNHIPHLQKGIEDLKISNARWTGGMAAILALLQLILKFF